MCGSRHMSERKTVGLH